MRITLSNEEFNAIYEQVDVNLKKILEHQKEKAEKSSSSKKLKQGAAKAQQTKIQNTIDTLNNSINLMRLENTEITPWTLHKQSGISYITVKKYWSKIAEKLDFNQDWEC